MLTLNRPHRQGLATLALLATTVVPSGYVAWTAWRINRPGHAREIEAEIGRQLGLRASIGAVRHPRPGEDVLLDVALRQEERRGREGAEVALARSVRIRRAGESLTLEVDGLRLRGEGPKQAMAQVSALLTRAGGDGAFRRASLSAPDCEIDLGLDGLRYSLRNVAGTLVVDGEAPAVTVSYFVPGDGTSTRCELTLERDRRADPVRTTLEFRTMEGLPLPARVLDPFFDAAEWLGPSARVEGTLTLRQAGASDWEAEYAGNLIDIDLAALVGRRFSGHRLNGRARAEIASARWAERRGGQGFGWVEARGELTTGAGSVSMGLLRALKAEMSFRVPAALEGHSADLPFHNLGLQFAMTGDGEILLDGGLGAEYPPDAVLVDAHHLTPLASAPEGAANVRGLIRTLFPTEAAEANLMVPDTAESRILRYLPAPPTVAKRGDVMTN